MRIKGGELEQIGVVHSPYKGRGEAPHQGRRENETCTLEIFEPYEAALKDVERCTHLFVLYWQHQADRTVLKTRTPWGPEVRGVFATRSPNRPNPVGLCVVDLLGIEGRRVKVMGMDAVDGSPLIDIKPYSSSLDAVQGAGIGWRDREGSPGEERVEGDHGGKDDPGGKEASDR